MPPRARSSNPSPARSRLTAVAERSKPVVAARNFSKPPTRKVTSSHVEILGTVSEARAAGGAASSPMASSAMPADSLAALDSDGSPRHLVVDALNLLTDYFLPVDRGAAPKSDAWTMLAVMQRRVAGFLEACANTTPALVPHFVIDAGWQSEEAATKWRKRREQEVRTHTRTIPLSADTFLADALRGAGAKVYQVEGADGDDIVVVLARALGATSLILSADRDMFRYDDTVLPDAPNRVAASFSFAEAAPRGTRVFRKVSKEEPSRYEGYEGYEGYEARSALRRRAPRASLTKQPKEGVKRRGSTEMPRFDPSVDFERWSEPYDKLKTVVDHPALGYVRGACSPQTRAFGNLHGHARPLRLAAYRAMGARGRVHERFRSGTRRTTPCGGKTRTWTSKEAPCVSHPESATRDASSSSAPSSDVGDERAGPSACDACLLEDVSNDTTLADDHETQRRRFWGGTSRQIAPSPPNSPAALASRARPGVALRVGARRGRRGLLPRLRAVRHRRRVCRRAGRVGGAVVTRKKHDASPSLHARRARRGDGKRVKRVKRVSVSGAIHGARPRNDVRKRPSRRRRSV